MYPLVVLSHVQPRYTCNPVLMLRVMHPQKLRACAEPRRAAARGGDAPLALLYFYAIISARTTLLQVGNGRSDGSSSKVGTPAAPGAFRVVFDLPSVSIEALIYFLPQHESHTTVVCLCFRAPGWL